MLIRRLRCLYGNTSQQRPLVGDEIWCAGSLPAEMDSGQLAKWVSNASFATLTLIYSFTQMLDLASHFATLAGVTLRVGQLLQVRKDTKKKSLHLSVIQL